MDNVKVRSSDQQTQNIEELRPLTVSGKALEKIEYWRIQCKSSKKIEILDRSKFQN